VSKHAAKKRNTARRTSPKIRFGATSLGTGALAEAYEQGLGFDRASLQASQGTSTPDRKFISTRYTFSS
jgi:hypothetical protein